LTQMQYHLRDIMDSVVAANKAPLPDDPALITRHIKETTYFLRADQVEICELPPYAVLNHNLNDGQPVECSH